MPRGRPHRRPTGPSRSPSSTGSGQTTIEAVPDQDRHRRAHRPRRASLALGVTPVGVTDWLKAHPSAIGPWATDEVEGELPTLVGDVAGAQLRGHRRAAARPDPRPLLRAHPEPVRHPEPDRPHGGPARRRRGLRHLVAGPDPHHRRRARASRPRPRRWWPTSRPSSRRRARRTPRWSAPRASWPRSTTTRSRSTPARTVVAGSWSRSASPRAPRSPRSPGTSSAPTSAWSGWTSWTSTRWCGSSSTSRRTRRRSPPIPSTRRCRCTRGATTCTWPMAATWAPRSTSRASLSIPFLLDELAPQLAAAVPGSGGSTSTTAG